MRYGILGLVAAAIWYGALPAQLNHHATTPTLAATQQGDHWTWSGRIASGRTLEIRGINGEIAAEPAPGDEAQVTADKHARRDDPKDVRIEVVEHEGSVTICAVYPGAGNRCEPGGSRQHVHDNDVQVDFTVRVPRGVTFEGATVNGSVEAANLAGPVRLHTVNGGARLETSGGDASAETVNGSVTATIRALGDAPLRFRTVNGGITLSLPAGLSADLDARTVNGSIESDFPITVSGRMNPRELHGQIGQGGRSLDVQTVNGSIQVRRLP
jgi:hypothetical protein